MIKVPTSSNTALDVPSSIIVSTVSENNQIIIDTIEGVLNLSTNKYEYQGIGNKTPIICVNPDSRTQLQLQVTTNDNGYALSSDTYFNGYAICWNNSLTKNL